MHPKFENHGSSSAAADFSLTDPLLPLHHQEDNGRCTVDPVNKENFSDLRLNETSEYDYSEHFEGNIPNIRRILASTWFGFTGRAIWNPTISPVLLYLWYPNHLERVGYVTAAMGLSQVTSTTLTYYCLSPIWKRHYLLRLAAVIGFASVCVTVYALLVKNELYWLVGGLSSWGFMWGITDVAMPSLFADSLPDDEEPIFYTRASRVIRSSNTLGPVILLLLFYFYLGNHWTDDNCAIAIIVGLAICLPMILLLCCLVDVSVVDEVDFPDEIQVDDFLFHSEEPAELSTWDVPSRAIDNAGNVTEQTATITALLDSSQGTEHEDPIICGCSRQSNAVPALVLIASILSSVASGVSIRYVPIFLVGKLGLSPIGVQILYLITPLGQAIFNSYARGLARFWGASLVTIALQWSFVALLASMLFCYENDSSTWIVLGLYLGHSCLMNSTTSLTQSILWSTVHEGGVSKFSAMENLQLLSWTIGAAVGGYLVRTEGIVVCLWATVALQLLATLPIVLLCCVGPSQEKVNLVLFPGSPTYSNNVQAFSSLRNPNESSSEATAFGDSQEIFDSLDDGKSSSEVFYDCASQGTCEDDNSHIAHYDRAMRCCVYNDGSAAHVPAGTSPQSIPANFLQGCHGDYRRANKQWAHTQEWRRKEEVWKIHTLPNPWYTRIKEMYPHFIHGFTKNGYPVIYEQPGKMKLKQIFREGCTIGDMTRWYTFLMEYLGNCVVTPHRHRELSDRSRGWAFVVVMDMENAGVSMLSTGVLSYLKQAGEINASHYPLTMKQSYLMNAGSLVPRLWPGIRKVLPDSVHVEIIKCPTYLKQFIDEEQIPPEYGGTSLYALGEHPDELDLRSLAESLAGKDDK